MRAVFHRRGASPVRLRSAFAWLALAACCVLGPTGAWAQPRNCALILDGVWDNRPEASARERVGSFAQMLWLRDFTGYDEAREWLALFDIELDRVPFRPQGLTPLRDWQRWSAGLAQLDPAQSAEARAIGAFLQAANARARRLWEECYRSEGLRLSWRLGADPGQFTLLLRWNPSRPQEPAVHMPWHEIAPALNCLRELKAMHLVSADGREIACDRRAVPDPIVIRVLAAAPPLPLQLLVPPLRPVPPNP